MMINSDLTFTTDYLSYALSSDERRDAARIARAYIAAKDCLFSQLVDINVISVLGSNNTLENKIVLRCRQDYVSMIYHERALPISVNDKVDSTSACLFCFMLSEKFEPVVTIVVVDALKGKLHQVTESHVDQLEIALGQFRTCFGISGEMFSYTSEIERNTNALHSRHWHLRMRIPTEMYMKFFPSIQVLCRSRKVLNEYVTQWEPLGHNFALDKFSSWIETKQIILRDIFAYQQNGLTERERQQVLAMKDAMHVET